MARRLIGWKRSATSSTGADRRLPLRSRSGLLGQELWIIPIPGTTNPKRLEENIGAAESGYIIVDRWMPVPAKHAHDCAGPSGLAASQTPAA
jgi:hypothetical protein